MLDLHNHVLFGLDDGCRSPEESQALCERAKAHGHSGFVATPHIRPGMFDNDIDTILRRRDETAPIVAAAGLELFLGAEYYFSPELRDAAKEKRLLTLGERSRYVLIELPQNGLPTRYAEILFELRLLGYFPVIAHPERCSGVQSEPAKVHEALSRVALLQLDLGSLIGHYGDAARKTALELVKRGAYHAAAGDLHRPEDVDKIMPKAKKELSALLKKRKLDDGWQQLTERNPRLIVANAEADSIVAV